MELFTLRLCSRLSSMPAVPSSRKWSRDPGRSTQTSPSSQDLTSILKDGRGRCRWSLLSSSIGTMLRMFRSEVELDDFRGSAKVQKLPTSFSSSELSAHQMAPSGVIAHQAGSSRTRAHGNHFLTSNGKLAVLPLGMAIQTLVDYVGRFRRASFRRAFPLFFGFPIFGVRYFLRIPMATGTAGNSNF